MSNNVKTWKVLRWDKRPENVRPYFLCCPKCGNDAELEIGPTPGGIIIAAIALGLIFDPAGYTPPPNTMPDEIQCRKCRKIFEHLPNEEESDVR